MLSLAKLPSEAEIDEIRKKKQEEAERRIELERRQTQLNLARRQMYGIDPSSERLGQSVIFQNVFIPTKKNVGYNYCVLQSKQYELAINDDLDNPLIEQMNIIRGYIKQARDDLKFEEVSIFTFSLLSQVLIKLFFIIYR